LVSIEQTEKPSWAGVVSFARRPEPAALCLRRDDARRIDDVRATGWAVVRRCGGDEDVFRSLIEPHRPALHAHCYRMLGSPHDAEDALQNTFLRAWRALPKFRGQSSLRSWLYRIATNVCIDAIARRPSRALPIDLGPGTCPGDAPERPLSVARAIDGYPYEAVDGEDGDAAPESRYERREALELALIAALHHLPARQRAALILRDGLGFSAKEAAESLKTTVASVNAALLRARRAVERRVPEPSRQANLRALGDRRLREIVERFADAFERGEIDAILAMLAEDAAGGLALERAV
jgi:RNA polymerase sigma-70 factor, ECF subfamily